jgi:hypothetical protein
MKDTRISTSVYEYSVTGRRNISQPRDRWTEKYPWRRNTPEIRFPSDPADDDIFHYNIQSTSLFH